MAPQIANGVAITNDTATRIKKSFDNSFTIPDTLEPNTFRIPISLLLCSALNAASPNKPRHEIRIATKVNELMICDTTISFSYCFCTSLSRNEYSNGELGFVFPFPILKALSEMPTRIKIGEGRQIRVGSAIGWPT